jgi:hypothetical protein
MGTYQFNPLTDPRWGAFLERQPNATVFHTAGWLEALRRTYGYDPVVFTSTPPDRELSNAIVFCRVRSWLTGSRLVSVPFSDHCEPLMESPESFAELAPALEASAEREGWKYIEIRPLSSDLSLQSKTHFAGIESYYLHMINLRPDLDVISRSFHKKSVHHKLNRADRELTYEEGRSAALLTKFYNLLVITRRRHQLPPQPIQWFRNLLDCLGESVTIRVASKDGEPVASIMTLFYGNSLVSKYGVSDSKFHHLGGIPLLIWRGIQDGKNKGATMYDLGRSELDNAGLISFKDNFGAARLPLNYYRYPPVQLIHSNTDWRSRIVKNTFSRMPDSLLTISGRLLYRHIG